MKSFTTVGEPCCKRGNPCPRITATCFIDPRIDLLFHAWDLVVRAAEELRYLVAQGVRTEFGTEYRREDFTHTGGHALFLTMTLVLSL